MNSKEEKKKEYAVSKVMADGSMAELTFNPKSQSTQFALFKDGGVKQVNIIAGDEGEEILPYRANDLIKNGVVLLPSQATDFGSEKELLEEIRSFIHRYLDVSEFFEKIATYYVLFTWVYDRFSELPYLRALGDYGSGKTRLLQTVGSICYKPIFAGGATTVSPIFRIINDFKGTLILDEADFRFSDTTVEIVKILNNGFAKGFPVLRSEGQKSFQIRSFDVFGPKILGNRQRFQDKALESRFLVEEMGKRKLREGIPHNLKDTFRQEALAIRDKLLMWRFRNYEKSGLKEHLVDRSLEPRLNQIVLPLLSVIEDEGVKSDLKRFVAEYNQEIISDRGMETDGQILETIVKINQIYPLAEITIKHIADSFNLGEDIKDKISARKMGWYIRERLKLKTRRENQGYVLLESNRERIEVLKAKFGITEASEQVNVVNVKTPP